jgi:hypothetical protein
MRTVVKQEISELRTFKMNVMKCITCHQCLHYLVARIGAMTDLYWPRLEACQSCKLFSDEAQNFCLLCISHLLRDLICRIKHHLAEFIHILEVETEDAGR